MAHAEHAGIDAAILDSKDDELRFIAAVEVRAELPTHVRAATAANVTVCTLADRLTPGQAHLLIEAIPPRVRRLFECGSSRGGTLARLDHAEFLEQLSRRLAVTPAHAELIGDAVFTALRSVLPDEITAHVAVQLPQDLRDLWLGTRPPIVGAMTASESAAEQELLTDIADRIPLPLGVSAPDALSAVVCAFSSRLSRGEALDVFLGLPHGVRPLLERCLVQRFERSVVFDREQLARRVAEELGTTPSLAEQIIGVVLNALKGLLPARAQEDVASQLPRDLREAWESA